MALEKIKHYDFDDEIALPPEEGLQIIYPEDHWYCTETDPIAHERELRLDRGFFLSNKWWEKQDLSVSYLIQQNTQYSLYGIEELKSNLLRLHKRMSPWQHLEGREIVIGNGAAQLLNAILYALVVKNSAIRHHSIDGKTLLCPLYVTQQLPAYLELKKTVDAFLGHMAHWIPFSSWREVPPEDLVEFVTTLGNPDGEVKVPKTRAEYIVHDRVNHMPTMLNEAADEYFSDTLEDDQISVFSLSKFLGFSGSRVGYAFVWDPETAHFMRYYIMIDTHGICMDGQMRCNTALNYLQEGNNLEQYILFFVEQLRKRWGKLAEVLPETPIKLLNKRGANAWIKIPGYAAERFFREKYNIHATYGPEYGVGEEYARVNMLGKDNEFAEFLYRLRNFG